MWDARYLKRIDFRTLPLIFALVGISLLMIALNTPGKFSSPFLFNQMKAFFLGTGVYLLLVCFDYRRLRSWSIFLYVGVVILLVGLFFVSPIHHVRRWYRFPFIPFDVQPSEVAKIAIILTLSSFLERRLDQKSLTTLFGGALFVLIPFVLILKQPDLGTAFVLIPVSLALFWIAGIHQKLIGLFSLLLLLGLGFIFAIFMEVISFESLHDFFTLFMKEYQYQRLNPNAYHTQAGQTAIALGRFSGTGVGKAEFSGNHWLPYAYTDSIFAAFSEGFGLFGALVLLALFFVLVYFSMQVALVASDPFGRLVAVGLSVYLAVHVVINVGMMCGFLPITGVPLLLVSYGGSSLLSTLAALGLLQSIYSRRHPF